MKKDIQDRDDIARLVEAFYERLLSDLNISHFFTEDIISNLKAHLERISDFWVGIIFSESNYRGNPMIKHLELNKRLPMSEEHFMIWMQHWSDSVNHMFEGENAKTAISRAESIAALMLFKVQEANRDKD